MRKYLLPAMKYASRALPQPADFRVFMGKRRTLTMSMVMSFLVVTATGMMAVNAASNDEAQNVTKYEKHAEGKSSSTVITNEVPQEINGDESASSADSKTSIVVEGEPVHVPENGNYSKTITTEDGTTQVNVSNNTSSTGSGFSGSVTTQHTNISSSTITNDVRVHSSP